MAARNFLAFDLGAESGRAVLGTLDEREAHARGEAPLRQPHRPDERPPALEPAGAVGRAQDRPAQGRRRGAGAAEARRHRRRHLGRRLRPARPRRRRPRQPRPLPRRPHRRHDGEGVREGAASERDLRGHRHPVHAAQLAVPAPRDARAEAARCSTPPRRCCSCRTCSTTCSPACARREFSIATTSQMYDPRKKAWATDDARAARPADAHPAGDRPVAAR